MCNGVTYHPGYLYIHHIKHLTMSLISLIIILIVVGFALWLVNNYIPMDRKIKNILNIVVVILVIIWLLRVFGLLDSLNNIRV
jgi:hypothetical protein